MQKVNEIRIYKFKIKLLSLNFHELFVCSIMTRMDTRDFDSTKSTEKSLNKIFIIFLVLHVALWSLLPLIRQILPIDAMECVYWGSLADFGTNKHPPLAGWIAYFVYNIFKTDFSIYLIGQLSIIIGFIYLYKLGKIFLGSTKSILAVMILEACFAYTYMGIYDGFNPNFLMLCFLPAISYYFYKSVNETKIYNWLMLGCFTGLSFLAKYQTLMLFIPLLLYLLITKQGREQFKKKGFYCAFIVAFLLILPHLVWLYHNDFFSFNYFIACEDRYSTFYSGPLKYIYSPFIFLFNQLVAVLGVIFIYFTAFLFSREKRSQEKNINNNDKLFILLTGIAPLVLQSFQGLNGNYMIPQWGYSLLFMSGILLFSFFPFKLNDKTIKYIICWVFSAMVITFTVLLIVFATEKNFANRFPVEQITEKLNNIYKNSTGKNMNYIGGFIELTIPIHLYNNDYKVILDTYGHKNIWIDEDDLRKEGALIIGRNPALMNYYIKSSVPNLVDEPAIKPFEFTVKSAVGRERIYTMYYAIVPSNAKYKD